MMLPTELSFHARSASTIVALALVCAAAPTELLAHVSTEVSQGQPQSGPAQAGQQTNRVVLPEVTVSAQKEPARIQDLPVSVTPISAAMLEGRGIRIVSDAAVSVPNTVFTEFTARKLSNARFRGIGSSPSNPAITTFLDGVPQLSANTSSIELLSVEQIEFVRGGQSALFGRNTLGGVVNVTSTRPSLARWSGRVKAPFGNFSERNLRAELAGPLTSTLGFGIAVGRGERDGFSTNQVTGHTIDDRSATFGKAQLYWTPSPLWETRLIVGRERSRDGDYALNDLDAVRATPFQVSRDFEGRQDRDVSSGTLVARREGPSLSFTSTTGYVRWTTVDTTDLDYTAGPLITRDNSEGAHQFTQEFRVASSAATPLRLGNSTVAWQVGVFGFIHEYDQDAVNTFSPFVLSQFVTFPVDQHSPKSSIDESGLSAFGRATVMLSGAIDVSVGLRADSEEKRAKLRTFFEPAVGPAATVEITRSWTNVSPSAALTYRFGSGHMVYASAARGFKAGGFNPIAPPSAEAYNEESTWNTEAGLKTVWADGRIWTTATAFSIDWSDLQLNLPLPGAPGQFYISNVGGATSRGLELELTAQAAPGVDIIGSLGYTRARFADGSVSSGADVSGNEIPFTPDVTAMVGVQVSRDVNDTARAFGRAEVVHHGAFQFDDANTAGEEAYTLVNLRAGVQIRGITVDGWIKNAFDTRYVPTAFAYPGFAPSGFVAEPGRPRTFGVGFSVGF